MDSLQYKAMELSKGLREDELIQCVNTNKTYLFTNNELLLMKQDEDKLSQIPQWLINDINDLNLADVRLSCAVYELYDHYAETRKPELTIDENSKWLDLVNERLDWIDNNIGLLDFAINHNWK